MLHQFRIRSEISQLLDSIYRNPGGWVTKHNSWVYYRTEFAIKKFTYRIAVNFDYYQTEWRRTSIAEKVKLYKACRYIRSHHRLLNRIQLSNEMAEAINELENKSRAATGR